MSIERLPDLVNGNAALVRRGRYFHETFLVEVGETGYLLRVEAGRIVALSKPTVNLVSWTFAIRAAADVWERFWQPYPEPGFHDLIALLRYGRVRLEGNLQPLMANLLYLKAVLETPRSMEGRP